MAEKTKINTEELTDKQKALDAALRNIEKSFGKGAVMRLGDDAAKLNVEVISTSSIGLDMALGVGGVPRGRVVEIYGPNPPVKQRSPCISLPKPKRPVATPLLLMLSMPWIPPMQKP